MEDLQPVHYDIHIIPDMDSFKFKGEITIYLHAEVEVQKVVLNSHELTYQKILLDNNELDHELKLAEQELHIDLPSPHSGDLRLSIEYAGEINDKLAGLYRSKDIIDGEERYVAVTQFQESDARRAFPCFDSPEYKTTYDIAFTLPQDFVAISNTSIVEEKELADGLKQVVFEKTPKMSTYLVFFGFGGFEWIEEQYKNIPLRVVASPGKAEQYGQLAMEYGRKSLEYCEEYFGIDYPLSKMDLIATPDFAAGAMENWGAILFRENALLYYPGITTEGGKVGIKNVIAHEIAHQWFGNLVTPDKWKFVWLNESFATYFAFKTIDHFEPEFGIFDYFINSTTNGALGADGYHQTAPIEQEGDEPAAYTVKTIPILYSKGGSVLRQLEGFLGDEMFRDGLRHYLKKHEYDVAGSEDLWKAFEEVSGQPISEMMDQWVMQMGYPQIITTRNGSVVHLEQSRFTYLNREYDTKWMIPLTVRQYLADGTTEDQVILMRDKAAEIQLKDNCEAFKININHTGFYRVLYEKLAYETFGQMIKDKKMTPIDRFNIENDLYAFLRSGKIDLEYYLDFLENFQDEDNHLPLGSISNHLNSLYNVLDGDSQQLIAKKGKRFYEAFLEKFGFESREDELHNIKLMRGQIIARAAKFGSETAKSFAMEKQEKIKNNEDVDPNLVPAVLGIVARETNDWIWFASQLENAESETEKQRYIAAMGNFTTAENIEKYQFYVFDEIPARNRGTAINTLCNNPDAKDTIWEWYLANLDNFEKLHPFIYQSALMNVITASVANRDEVVEFFDDYVKKNPQVQDPADKALETLDIRASMQKRYH